MYLKVATQTIILLTLLLRPKLHFFKVKKIQETYTKKKKVKTMKLLSKGLGLKSIVLSYLRWLSSFIWHFSILPLISVLKSSFFFFSSSYSSRLLFSLAAQSLLQCLIFRNKQSDFYIRYSWQYLKSCDRNANHLEQRIKIYYLSIQTREMWIQLQVWLDP